MILRDPEFDVNATGSGYFGTPLYIACRNGNVEEVKLLLNSSRINVNYDDRLNNTPLIIAIHEVSMSVGFRYAQVNTSRYLQIIQMLLDDPRVDINVNNDKLQNAFYLAASVGNNTVLEMLLKHPQLDLNTKNMPSGDTAFSIAAYFAHVDTVSFLMSLHPRLDVIAKNWNGKSALDVAYQKYNDPALRKRYGEKHKVIIDMIEDFLVRTKKSN
jgi:ankyrin repeat protein